MAAGDLTQLAADLAKGVDMGKVRDAVDVSGKAIQTRMRSDASRSRHFRLAPTITTESREFFGGPGVEVGPEKRGAGNLGVIAYFGGVNGGGGTLADPMEALEAESPRFIRALEDLAGDVL